MKKILLIIVLSIFSSACAIYKQTDKNSDAEGHPAARYEGIAFSGYYHYQPPLEPANTNSSERMTQKAYRIFDRNNYKIKVMSREFLDPDFTESPIFGYYAYLIFTDQSSAAYPLRKEAAKAFMCRIQDTDKSTTIGVSTKNIAVFYAPVNPGTAREIKKQDTSETLLKRYNYTLANALIAKIYEERPVENFTVGIIAHPALLNLRNADSIILDKLDVINLSDIPPVRVGAIIRKLRQAILNADQIKEIKIPGNKQADFLYHATSGQFTPVFVDLVIDDFPALVRTILSSVNNLLPQVETAEASSIICK